jgi:DNA repair ATPase RecN
MVLAMTDSVSASTRADVNILEATENIRYLSQKIAKSYIYYYANPKKEYVRQEIAQDLDMLVGDIRTIAITTGDDDTKNILEFLSYNKEQISDLVNRKPDKEKVALMLDYSETLLEGANSIARKHTYEFNQNEKMLMYGKNIEFLAERGTKYYLAVGVGLGSKINREQMKESLDEMEKNLARIEAYGGYPSDLQSARSELKETYDVTSRIFAEEKKVFLSNLANLATRRIKSLTDLFILFHSKNQ